MVVSTSSCGDIPGVGIGIGTVGGKFENSAAILFRKGSQASKRPLGVHCLKAAGRKKKCQ
jgi:hypothetical protein